MKEIERQFLVRSVAPSALDGADEVLAISQGYLTEGDPAVRVRRRGRAWILTVKSGSGLVREEVEVGLDEASGHALLEIAGERRLEKTRYRIGPWELDVFGGKLEGLVVLEVELPHENAPTPPFPAGVDVIREVTGTSEYRNQALAGLSWDEARDLAAALEEGGS